MTTHRGEERKYPSVVVSQGKEAFYFFPQKPLSMTLCFCLVSQSWETSLTNNRQGSWSYSYKPGVGGRVSSFESQPTF